MPISSRHIPVKQECGLSNGHVLTIGGRHSSLTRHKQSCGTAPYAGGPQMAWVAVGLGVYVDKLMGAAVRLNQKWMMLSQTKGAGRDPQNGAANQMLVYFRNLTSPPSHSTTHTAIFITMTTSRFQPTKVPCAPYIPYAELSDFSFLSWESSLQRQALCAATELELS